MNDVLTQKADEIKADGKRMATIQRRIDALKQQIHKRQDEIGALQNEAGDIARKWAGE